MKIRPGLARKVNNYLLKHNCRPQNLTQEQYQACASQIRLIHHSWFLILTLALCGIVILASAVSKFHKTQTDITCLGHKEIIAYVLITETGEEILEPEQVENTIARISDTSLEIGIAFMAPVYLAAVAVIVLLDRKKRIKLVNSLIPHNTPQSDDGQNTNI